MNRIRNSIFGARKRTKPITDDELIEMHHNMMVVYGWIPINEFKKIPLPTLFNLNKYIRKELINREKLRIYTLKYYGVKDIN